MKDNPGLSLTDVASKITEATKGLVTDTGLQTALSTALKGVATQQDIKDAIAGIEFPAGITKEDVAASIKTYMDANPGLKAADVTTAITNYMKENPPVSKEDVTTAITTATKDLATAADLATLETNLLTQIATNEQAGMDRDTATQTAISDLATELGTTRKDILTKIGTTEKTITDYVETKIGAQAIADDPATTDIDESKPATGIYAAISDMQTALVDKIAANETAGMTRDQATQKAVADLATELGTTKESILGQIGTQAVADNPATKDVDESKPATGIYAALAGVSSDVQTKYNSLTDEQKTLATQLTTQGVDLNAAITQVQNQTQAGFTGLSNTLAANQAATLARSDALSRANAAQALKTQRSGNLNTLMDMLGQAQDTSGQQVTVKAADPAKIGYVYDFNSIFANPAQQNMFVSPYAEGGLVDGADDVNDELLKILKG
jgi:hypothetical protein